MRVFLKFLAVFTVVAAVSCEVFFEENFTDGECHKFNAKMRLFDSKIRCYIWVCHFVAGFLIRICNTQKNRTLLLSEQLDLL